MNKFFTLFCIVFFLFITKTQAQIYQHNFGTTTISAYPYTVAPPVIDANLNTSSWSNSIGSWTSFTGSGASPNKAIANSAVSSGATYTLTFNVASGYCVDVTSFSFGGREVLVVLKIGL